MLNHIFLPWSPILLYLLIISFLPNRSLTIYIHLLSLSLQEIQRKLIEVSMRVLWFVMESFVVALLAILEVIWNMGCRGRNTASWLWVHPTCFANSRYFRVTRWARVAGDWHPTKWLRYPAGRDLRFLNIFIELKVFVELYIDPRPSIAHSNLEQLFLDSVYKLLLSLIFLV